MNFIKTKEEHHFCIGRFSNLRGAKPNVGKHEKKTHYCIIYIQKFFFGKKKFKISLKKSFSKLGKRNVGNHPLH
jgi:hypothetical protein